MRVEIAPRGPDSARLSVAAGVTADGLGSLEVDTGSGGIEIRRG